MSNHFINQPSVILDNIEARSLSALASPDATVIGKLAAQRYLDLIQDARLIAKLQAEILTLKSELADFRHQFPTRREDYDTDLIVFKPTHQSTTDGKIK
jgi:hypothetical protein